MLYSNLHGERPSRLSEILALPLRYRPTRLPSSRQHTRAHLSQENMGEVYVRVSMAFQRRQN